MTGTGAVAVFASAFVLTHLLLSHPLRTSLAARLGPRGFSAAYSAVALATFIPMILARKSVGAEAPLWMLGEWAWVLATVLMWIGSILFVGSFRRNPAMLQMGKEPARIGEPGGVFRITRHPMMWGFALWALAHLLVHSEPSAVIVAFAILSLALVGSLGQDRKKAEQLGDEWRQWKARTSFVPFARGVRWPGTFAVVGGTILFLAATWLHPYAVGLWK